MTMPVIAVVLGLALLVWGAERFVLGASALARKFGVPPLLIGLTIVGIGTSAPEMFVSATAAWQGNPGVAIGNAIGSNIANVGLVIGVTALIVPVSVRSRTLKREFLLMFAVLLLAGALLLDERLDRTDGIVLVLGFVALLGVMCDIAVNGRRQDPLGVEFAQEIPDSLHTAFALTWVVVGLLILLLSSRIIVWGAIELAREFGVSDLVIGLTVVAVGTSLPELAASVMSVVKREPDIAIGNVIGSNMFNMLPVLALPALIAPGAIPAVALQRDYAVMLVLSVTLFFVAYGVRGPGRINRYEGGVLLLVFVSYQYWLYAGSLV